MSSATALCTYRVKEDHEEQFAGLLRKHAPTLRKLGLLADEASQIFQGKDESGKTFFIEILPWKSSEGHKIAEQMPEVLGIWERMGQLVEARLGRPAMEFPLVEPLEP